MKTYKDLKPLTKEQMELINGSLLGDASLVGGCNNPNHNWRFSKRQSKFDKDGVDKKNYMDWHFSFLGEYSSNLSDNKIKNKYNENTTLKLDYYFSYDYVTYAHPIFTDLAKKWYKNDGQGNWDRNKNNKIIKIIPNDLKLTPLSLCIWLMDDGFCYPKDANAVLCTHGFTIDEVDFLTNKLKQDLNISAKRRIEWRGYPIIYIGRKSYFDMIEMIKPHVYWDCFKYKLDVETYNKIPNRGETSANAKLSENDVRKIFELYKQKLSNKEIAKIFEVNDALISMIINGRRWGHLKLYENTPSKRKKPHCGIDTINEIFKLNEQNLSHSEIGRKLDINQSTVSRILKRHVNQTGHKLNI